MYKFQDKISNLALLRWIFNGESAQEKEWGGGSKELSQGQRERRFPKHHSSKGS